MIINVKSKLNYTESKRIGNLFIFATKLVAVDTF